MKIACAITFVVLLACGAYMSAQQQATVQSTVLLTPDPRPLVQKYFGTTAPGSVAGNLPGDVYLDQGAHKFYICDAPAGTSAPACRIVGQGAWTLLNVSGALPTPPPPPPPVSSAQWSMGFWTAWAADPNAHKISEIVWGAYTHIIQVGVEPNSNGSLTYSDVNFAANATALIAAARANNVKVLLNVWAGPGDFNGAVNNLTTFSNNLMNIVNQYGFDGIDVDWESGMNAVNLRTLLANLRTRLGTKLLTADAVTNDSSVWSGVHQYLDRVNVMTYDEFGNWNPYSWFNSALLSDACDCVWSMDLTKRRYLTAGIPAAKLSMGLPFYGWTSNGGGIVGPRLAWQPTLPNTGQITYTNLIAQYPSAANPLWDAGSHTPYISTPTGWVTFDNAQSISEKVAWIKTNNLGGWIVWAMDQDYLATATVKHPLSEAIKAAR